MKVSDFDLWIKENLPLSPYKKIDASLNGLQVGHYEQPLKKIAFALDACQASILQAAQQQADLLFVHHGLFWGQLAAIEGALYQQITLLIQNNISLYAVHLPLDAVGEFGNNACVAGLLDLQNCQAFADIGIIGNLPVPLSTAQVAQKVFPSTTPLIWDNASSVHKVAIIVGSGAKMAIQAAQAGADCYITGEPLHQVFHFCQESRLSFIAGGHYSSEMIGLRQFKNRIQQSFPDLQTYLIDIPTGV